MGCKPKKTKCCSDCSPNIRKKCKHSCEGSKNSCVIYTTQNYKCIYENSINNSFLDKILKKLK